MMKKYRWVSAFLVLVLASLACQTIIGGGTAPTDVDIATPSGSTNDNFNQSSNANINNSGSGESDTTESGLPLPPDATEVTEMGTDLVTFQTKMNAEEVMDYYREVLGQQGYTERTELTTTAAGTFSIVFDGDPSGKALIIQGAPFGEGLAVTIYLQEI